MRIASILAALTAFTTLGHAQTTINGKVEDVQNTQNQFYLGGTVVPVVSNVLDLNQWVGQQALLDVVDIGVPGAPVLRIDAAVPAMQVMNMGNLRLGQTKTWEVFAPTGSVVFVFLDWTPNTGFLPLPGFGGAWLLGLQPHFETGGVTTQGVFQTTYTTPNNPTLVGLMVSSQAVVATNGVWSFSNADGKTVRP
ncbi:MAG TPA: hypothetical protein ENI87_01160 [bacterium]|nr:hypothetical protein [bacterium]